MPYIDVNLSTVLSKEKETVIKAKLGECIEQIPGKIESTLMIQFKDNCRLWFGGESGDCAFVNIMVYGQSDKSDYEEYAKTVAMILSEELLISSDRIYVKYEEVPNWFRG